MTTLTTGQVARDLGVDPMTVLRWAIEWHGRTGHRHRHRLTPTDALVARAWYVIDGNPPTRGGCVAPGGPERRRLAEVAVRRSPKRWLLVSAQSAETYDEAEDAARAWLDSAQPAAQLIDLYSVPEESPDA